MWLRLSAKTQERVRSLLASAALLAAQIDPPVSRGERAIFGQKRVEERRPRFMAPAVASMAAKARRLAAEATCLSRLLERAASGQKPESEVETADGSPIGENAAATNGSRIVAMPERESAAPDSPEPAA